jgi:hypothetical protein
MGLYGSPDTGGLYSKKEKGKEEGYKPQKNIWVWAVIIIINILILLLIGINLVDVVTLLTLDSMVLFTISIVSLVVNLVKKRKIGNDIKFIGISILTFFIFLIILGTL